MWIWRRIKKISWVDKKTNKDILNTVQEDRKTLNTIEYSAININGWVVCYSMMDCYVMYWKEGCWVKEQEVEERYS